MADSLEIGEEDIPPRSTWLARRRQRREAHQALVVLEADKLFERYGAAAQTLARGSSRQVVGFERRQFWRDVAEELARREEAEALERRLGSLKRP